MSGKLDATQAERVKLLRNVQSLRALDSNVLEQIARIAELRNVERGETLIQEGQLADTLYIVLKGRFVVLVGKGPIAEISTGEPIGELAFFAGGKRTATVRAARNSTVFCLSRNAYDTLVKTTPELSEGILKALSERLARTISDRPELRPKVGKVCSIFPGGHGPIDPQFISGIKGAFASNPKWVVLDEQDCPTLDTPPNDIAAWLEEKETKHRNLVLMCRDPEAHPNWYRAAANTCDTVLFALGTTGVDPVNAPPSRIESDLITATLHNNVQLALYRTKASESTQGTSAWLKDRDVALHHHIALDSDDDFARLGRFIRGEALGLVLCGGGSLGTAHLGAIAALQERGFEFDHFGGTSIGAAMSAALATGLSPHQIMDLCDELFVKSKAMSRLTVPRHALLDHHTLDASLKDHYGGLAIEDAALNFFAVTTSLTHNDVRLMRKGPIWEGVRASTSLPGIFPPFICEDGEVLIDGGLLDNVPVSIMREQKAGPNLVLNFLAPKPWRVKASYNALPTRLQAFTGLIKRKAKGEARLPTLMSILSRSMVVNSRKLLQNVEIGDDVILNLSTIRGMSYLDWKRGRQLFEFAYDQMSQAMDQTDNNSQLSEMDQLRNAASVINSPD